MKKKRHEQMVKVEWVDSCSTNGWVDSATVQNAAPAICTSLGWIGRKTRQHMTLYSDYAEDHADECGRIITIPISCVKKIKHLR